MYESAIDGEGHHMYKSQQIWIIVEEDTFQYMQDKDFSLLDSFHQMLINKYFTQSVGVITKSGTETY